MAPQFRRCRPITVGRSSSRKVVSPDHFRSINASNPVYSLGRGFLFTGFQKRSPDNRHAKPRAFAAVVLVCVALLALLTVAQVAHTHAINSDADHCPLCIVMHSAAPVVVAAIAILLVQVGAPTPVIAVRPAILPFWHAPLFVRPPPIG